ncbi:hypothetical protein LP420_39680 [Massilia sp. B-10]|nr:hypothetical protein LP420_39680 [Massilia sp. B-10]
MSICSRVTTCTGSGVSDSICLMAEPVISTRAMGISGVWAQALAWARRAAANAIWERAGEKAGVRCCR